MSCLNPPYGYGKARFNDSFKKDRRKGRRRQGVKSSQSCGFFKFYIRIPQQPADGVL